MKITCIIIDDEPSSQSILKNFIEEVPFLSLSGVCNNAMEATTMLNANTDIDLLFLDINMPTISGLDFYKSLANPPKVIFTTAYAKYAVEGFESVNKVLDGLSPKQAAKDKEEHLIIKVNKVLHKVPLADIYYLEALGDYVKVHLHDSFLMTNSTFTKILETLPKNEFLRVHKSYAIHVVKLNSVAGNVITLGTYSVPVGQKYKADFLKAISS